MMDKARRLVSAMLLLLLLLLMSLLLPLPSLLLLLLPSLLLLAGSELSTLSEGKQQQEMTSLVGLSDTEARKTICISVVEHSRKSL